MRKSTLAVGLAALLLWAATAALTLTYDSGDGSPVGQGLVMLLAVILTVAFINGFLADRRSSGRSRR
jgi:hypothetical protein